MGSSPASAPARPIRVTARRSVPMPFKAQFGDQLASALRLRRMKEGLRLLAGAEVEIGRLGPDTPDAPRLLLLIAQWIDVGYKDHRLIDTILERFSQDCRRKMAVEDYLRMSMVEAFRDLAVSELD